jgi:ATP-dependent RNA helicase DeaD
MDVIGQAHTGTGKTAAFALPLLTKISNEKGLQALILVPTRELAVQVNNEITKFARYTKIKSVAIYGGQSIIYQLSQLKRGVNIVVATPGRLIDHLKQGSIVLDSVRFVILDEADRMLDMGFVDDIKFILFYVHENHQTCLFSATMPPEILRLSQDYMNQPKVIRLNEDLGLQTIDQSYLLINEKDKFTHLCNLIKQQDRKQAIVFVSTKYRTERLANDLKQEGYRAVTIHGDLSQKQRDIAMSRFKRGTDEILVATDIAARGIDVPAVGHVINYDIPEDPMVYFHRIGRTARAGASGKAISLVSSERMDDFERIIRKTEQPIRKINEELGIESPVVSHNTYQRRSYRDYSNRPYSYRNSYENSFNRENKDQYYKSDSNNGYGKKRYQYKPKPRY